MNMCMVVLFSMMYRNLPNQKMESVRQVTMGLSVSRCLSVKNAPSSVVSLAFVLHLLWCSQQPKLTGASTHAG